MKENKITGKRIIYLSRSRFSGDSDLDKYAKTLGKKELYKALYAPLSKNLYA